MFALFPFNQNLPSFVWLLMKYLFLVNKSFLSAWILIYTKVKVVAICRSNCETEIH